MDNLEDCVKVPSVIFLFFKNFIIHIPFFLITIFHPLLLKPPPMQRKGVKSRVQPAEH